MNQQIVLLHQERPSHNGEFLFHRGEIYVCIDCIEGGSYTITARPASSEEEASFWAGFHEDVEALPSEALH